MSASPDNITPATEAPQKQFMPAGYKLGLVLRRFFVPRFVVTIYGMLKWRANISTRAEVELSSNLRFGRGTTVGSFSKIKSAYGPVITGEECGFGTGCFIDGSTAGITMGDHVSCGPNVSIIANNYMYEQLEVPLEQQGFTSIGITIGRNVWIGAGSVILDGTVIGDNSIVVANSLVNRRFPPNSIIQGNPARVILERKPARKAAS